MEKKQVKQSGLYNKTIPQVRKLQDAKKLLSILIDELAKKPNKSAHDNRAINELIKTFINTREKIKSEKELRELKKQSRQPKSM